MMRFQVWYKSPKGEKILVEKNTRTAAIRYAEQFVAEGKRPQYKIVTGPVWIIDTKQDRTIWNSGK